MLTQWHENKHFEVPYSHICIRIQVHSICISICRIVFLYQRIYPETKLLVKIHSRRSWRIDMERDSLNISSFTFFNCCSEQCLPVTLSSMLLFHWFFTERKKSTCSRTWVNILPEKKHRTTNHRRLPKGWSLIDFFFFFWKSQTPHSKSKTRHSRAGLPQDKGGGVQS